MLDEVNWIGGDDAIDLPVRARIRSTGEPAHAALTLKENGAAEIVLAEAEEGVSPGRLACFTPPIATVFWAVAGSALPPIAKRI